MPSAGDVGRFAYCPHNWLLARQGHDAPDEASRAGVKAHAALGDQQDHVERVKKDYRQALSLSSWVLGVAASATLLALEVVFLRAHPFYYVMITVALVLLSASVALLVVALDAQRRYEQRQRDAGLVPGRLVGSDLSGPGALLQDPEWNLAGRPDYVLDTASGRVPVEVKSGRTPDRPYHSHVLQLACYLRLVEVTAGERPVYGLLTYPDGVFRVGWDDEVRQQLRGTLDRMEEAARTGVADRDHQDVGRCRGCARRSACDQRLA